MGANWFALLSTDDQQNPTPTNPTSKKPFYQTTSRGQNKTLPNKHRIVYRKTPRPITPRFLYRKTPRPKKTLPTTLRKTQQQHNTFEVWGFAGPHRRLGNVESEFGPRDPNFDSTFPRSRRTAASYLDSRGTNKSEEIWNQTSGPEGQNFGSKFPAPPT